MSLGDAIVQAKLSVGPAGDVHEREADQVADKVVASLSGGQRSRQAKHGAAPIARRVQRSATIDARGGTVDADTDRAIQSSRGGGRVMPAKARAQMEGAFGADFSDIRVHEGAQSADLNNRIQAKAFTVGSDVFFRDGMPDTSSKSGQHLLAHELTHTIQQGGADGTAQRIQRFGRKRRGAVTDRGGVSAEELAGGALDAAHEGLDSASAAAPDIGQAVPAAINAQVTDASEQFATTALSGKLIEQHIKQMAGVKGRRNALQKLVGWGNSRRAKERKQNPMGTRAKLHAFRGRAGNARAQVEQQDLAERDSRESTSNSDEFERQTLMSNIEERSDTRWKAVGKGRRGKKDTVVPDGAKTHTDEASGKTFFRRDKTASRRKYKAAYRARVKKGKDTKRGKQDARAIAVLVGKEVIQDSDLFIDSMNSFSGAVDGAVRAPTEAIGDKAVSEIESISASAEQTYAEATTRRESGTATGGTLAAAARAVIAATDKISVVASDAQAAIDSEAEKVGSSTIAALLPIRAKAFQTKLIKASKAGGAYDTATRRRGEHMKKLANNEGLQKYQKSRALANASKAVNLRGSEDGSVGIELQEKMRRGIADMSTGNLQKFTKESVQLGLQDNMHSALDAIVGIVAPDEDLNTLGASKGYAVSVSIPLPKPGKLELSFDLTATRNYDGKTTIKGTVRIKGGVEAATPGMSVSAMVGFGAYMEASSKDNSRLGTLLSFALYRRFRESRVIMSQTTDYLWGKSASMGLNKGKWENKQDARHRYAKQWGAMVEENFEDGEYAETGGIISAEAGAKVKGDSDKRSIGGSISGEYTGGTRYSKEIMENSRKRHAAKRGDDAEYASPGGRERKIGAARQKFDFKASGNVGEYGLQLGATVDFVGDGSDGPGGVKLVFGAKASMSKGDLFGDPAAYIAKFAEMAVSMSTQAGGLVMGAANKLQKDDKFGAVVGVVTNGASAAATVGTPIAALVKDGGRTASSDWAKSAAKGLSVKTLDSAKKGVADAGTKAVAEGKSKAGVLADQAGAAIGIESSKSTNVVLKGTFQPGKPFVVEFIIDQSSSTGVNIMQTVKGKMSSSKPVLYLRLKDGSKDKFVFLGGV
jgi:hypothetical protein